ncbi:Gfo/Idh/MocA family protein [Flavimarina sp. Hel_I_48]|uniref:Gfo/Idh/MocA family protein n=1 Tax=Flavimarina sp. Hel_I_48 TaxID=1392488 RepID=UPI0004DF8154|nr:Gfo/Idh/MocA family oxidoreductase [Flavimarina sp. Hel_I_48]
MSTRRDFLEKITISAIGLPLIYNSTNLFAAATLHEEGEILNVAILGLGSYGERVADAMQDCKRAKLVGLISGTPSKLTEWGAKYNIPEKNRYNYETYDQIKDNPDIDAVYIITPNALHKEAALRVAKASKHVISEKPMGLNAEEGQAMIDACKAAGVHLLVGYRLHFEPKTVAVIKMRQEGAFGKLNFFQGQTGFDIGDPTQWRLDKDLAGGGSLMDIGIYSINGARYITGEEPIWVTAQETKTEPEKFKEGVDETIQFQLGFPSGIVASCLSTYNMRYLDRFYLAGDEGFAEMQPSTGYGPIEGRTHKGKLTQPHTTHQTLQMDGMARIIYDNEQPIVPVDGEEGLKDLKIIDAIYKAVETGEKVEL